MDIRVVLIDANTCPGRLRTGPIYLVGPHRIPFAKQGLAKVNAPTTFSLTISVIGITCALFTYHIWFQQGESQKLVFYPMTSEHGQPQETVSRLPAWKTSVLYPKLLFPPTKPS